MQQHQLRPLAELGDYELENENQDIRGRVVQGPAGERLGAAHELLVDRDHDRVAAVRLQDGRVLPVENLEIRPEAVIYRPATADAGERGDEKRIPIVREELRVGKRKVDRGDVHVQSRVVETPVHGNVALREEHVSIERRPVKAPGAAGPDAFRERTVAMTERGEEPVVTKEAKVVEEVIVRTDVDQRVERIDDTVRHTEVDVEDQRTSGRGRDPV